MSRAALALAALAAVVAACGRDEAPPAATPADAGPRAAATAPPSTDSPVPPLSPHRGMGDMFGPPGGSPAAATVRFDMPARFRQQTPTSSMRLAQAEIPGPAGPGTLAIFHFGVGGGGEREANFERWISQVEVDAARPPERGQLTGGPGLQISWIQVAGTLMPTGMGGPDTPQPKSLLFGAVVEGEGGPWFLKATGPEATIAAARKELEALLASFRLLPSGATA